METGDFVKLGSSGSSYELLKANWQLQCEQFGEDFETYSHIPFSVFDEIVRQDKSRTALFALVADGKYHAVAMLNHADIPGYDGPVLRVRHILLSPEFDLGDASISDYSKVLVRILSGVLEISKSHGNLSANHINFHSRSPTDIQLFAAVGQALSGVDAYRSVQQKGLWLYITRK